MSVMDMRLHQQQTERCVYLSGISMVRLSKRHIVDLLKCNSLYVSHIVSS